MFYTYGNTAFYKRYLNETKENNIPAMKMGITEINGEIYGGGIAYKTIEEAKKGCETAPEPYTVFALNGDWDNDVYFDKIGGINRLKNDVEILYEVFEENNSI